MEEKIWKSTSAGNKRFLMCLDGTKDIASQLEYLCQSRIWGFNHGDIILSHLLHHPLPALQQ